VQYELPLFLKQLDELKDAKLPPQPTAQELLSSIAGKPQAEKLLSRFRTLTDLAKASVEELNQVPGIGKSKAAAIKSAFLLAQKLSQERTPELALLDTPDRVADLLREQNRLYDVEHFQGALLNTRQRLIEVHHLSQGTHRDARCSVKPFTRHPYPGSEATPPARTPSGRLPPFPLRTPRTKTLF
jgi:hypothetical protein